MSPSVVHIDTENGSPARDHAACSSVEVLIQLQRDLQWQCTQYVLQSAERSPVPWQLHYNCKRPPWRIPSGKLLALDFLLVHLGSWRTVSVSKDAVVSSWLYPTEECYVRNSILHIIAHKFPQYWTEKWRQQTIIADVTLMVAKSNFVFSPPAAKKKTSEVNRQRSPSVSRQSLSDFLTLQTIDNDMMTLHCCYVL